MRGTHLVIFLLLSLLIALCACVSTHSEESEVHDVAVTDVTAWPTLIGPSTLYINATVENQGTLSETFNLTVYANNITIKNVTVTDLEPGVNVTLTIIWELYPFRALIFPPPWPWPPNKPMVENLTIWSEADAVAGEIDFSDNVYTNGIVTIIWWVLDVDGNGTIEGKEVALIAKAYGSYPGHPRWDPRVDFNNDGKVEGKDFAVTAKYYGACYL